MLNSSNDAWNISTTGLVRSSYYTSTVYGINPTLYLKSEVEIVSGNGTTDEPYKVFLKNST